MIGGKEAHAKFDNTVAEFVAVKQRVKEMEKSGDKDLKEEKEKGRELYREINIGVRKIKIGAYAPVNKKALEILKTLHSNEPNMDSRRINGMKIYDTRSPEVTKVTNEMRKETKKILGVIADSYKGFVNLSKRI